MAELERKDYQIWGEEREEALRKYKEIIESWGIRMPEVKPQVLDLGLGDFYKVGLIEYWIANNEKEGYCGKFLFVFDSQACPYHHHNFKHETFFILKGKIGKTRADVRSRLRPKRLNHGSTPTYIESSLDHFTFSGGGACRKDERVLKPQPTKIYG